MHERQPEREPEETPAVTANVADDGDLRGDWLETAEYIADIESRLGARWQWEAVEGRGGPPEEDSSRPGFVLVGRRAYIDFVAVVASGIIAHGPAFAAWAQHVPDPRELHHFDDAYLGRYESVEHFALVVLAELGPQLIDDPGEVGQLRVVANPRELAELLQRRGDVSALADPEGGVFIFQGFRRGGDEHSEADGGEDD